MTLQYFDGGYFRSARNALARIFYASQIEVILRDTEAELAERLGVEKC